MPDQRHLYMLVAGVLLGVLLGPAVLGRVAPQLYDPMFLGSGDMTELDAARAELNAFIAGDDTDQRIEDFAECRDVQAQARLGECLILLGLGLRPRHAIERVLVVRVGTARRREDAECFSLEGRRVSRHDDGRSAGRSRWPEVLS